MRWAQTVRAALLLLAIAYTGICRGIASPGGVRTGIPMQGKVLGGAGTPVDVSPFGTVIEEGRGIRWEDPREIHRVVVRFRGAAPEARLMRLEYWTSRWPEQRLPKDRQPGGGDVGWWELGNWHTGSWRTADTEAIVNGRETAFEFRPVDEREHREVAGFSARYRYTLKLRVASDAGLPPIESIAAYTDSTWVERSVRVVWRDSSGGKVECEAFNGRIAGIASQNPSKADTLCQAFPESGFF